MDVIRGAYNLRSTHRGSVVTLGNFDGVHRGHQELLAQLRSLAREHRTRSTVVTFEPHPIEHLAPDRAPARLNSLREKIALFAEHGVDQVLVLRFDQRLADCSAVDFVETVLVAGLGMQAVVIGDDYRFGHRRQGDFALLRRLGRDHGFALRRMQTLTSEGERVSSSRIRRALAEGDVAAAAQLSGRPYRICGRVERGQQLGRQIGAPTANIAHRRNCALRNGVYCVALDGRPAVANFGVRPTVTDSPRQHLEVHVLDMPPETDLYGRRLGVDFYGFLRPELRFDGLDTLRAAIAQDVLDARDWFATHPRGDDFALAI